MHLIGRPQLKRTETTMTSCTRLTKRGAPCKLRANSNGYCHLHTPSQFQSESEAPPEVGIPEAKAAKISDEAEATSELAGWLNGIVRLFLYGVAAVIAGNLFFSVASKAVAILIAVSD
jgi:hypothetical protein